MHCATCNLDTDAATCPTCGATLKPRRPRRRGAAQADDDSPQAREYNRQVQAIFRVSLLSIIPFAGLILGPLGALRGWRLYRRAKGDPAFTADRAAVVAILLGTLSGLTNWLGLALMAVGLLLK